MKTTSIISLAAVVASAHALPTWMKTKRQDSNGTAIDDNTVLNYALTLEHLENAFYMQALERFDAQAFTAAGLPSWARGRFQEVSAHETAHVNFLQAALGGQATQPCQYNFPYDDPQGFAGLSQVLESVGVSAYIGAAQFISNKDYLTAAASILSTEARHASWVAGAVNHQQPWSGAFDVPLSLNQVYSLAAGFIVSCPDSNPTLPVSAFPTLAINGTAGQTVPVTYNNSGDASGASYVAFFWGLTQERIPIVDGQVTIPDDIRGTAYAFVTNSNDATTDATIVAGPAIISVPFNSNGDSLNGIPFASAASSAIPSAAVSSAVQGPPTPSATITLSTAVTESTTASAVVSVVESQTATVTESVAVETESSTETQTVATEVSTAVVTNTVATEIATQTIG